MFKMYLTTCCHAICSSFLLRYTFLVINLVTNLFQIFPQPVTTCRPVHPYLDCSDFVIFFFPSNQKCRQCRQCKTKQTSQWHIDYSLCDKCYQYKHKTNQCPLCNEEPGNQKVIQCDSCSRWVQAVIRT